MSKIIDPRTGGTLDSERRTLLVLTIIDKQPGKGDAERHQLTFALDQPKRGAVQKLMSVISRSVMDRLSTIGFFDAPEDQNKIIDKNGVVIRGDPNETRN